MNIKKTKKAIMENPYFSWIQFFSNWLFQGIFHADLTEKTYKILFTPLIGLLIFFGLWLSSDIDFLTILLLSLLIAHTINWLLNCNLFVLLVHRIKWVRIKPENYFNYLYKLQKRIKDKDFVSYCVCMGSICKGGLDESSDIDISIIRKPGFKNAILALVFYVKEKKIADFNGIPLDIFICDTPENNINRAVNQTKPIAIYNPLNKIEELYPSCQTIGEAKLLNRIV